MTQQLKNICFTSFNTELEWFKDWTKINKSIVNYIIIQGELTKDGKKHIQGYAQFNGKKRMEQIKKFFGDETLHIEKAMGTPEQASNYCKEEKNGRFHNYEEYGELDITRGQGRRTDLLELRDMIKEGMSLNRIAMTTDDNKILHNIMVYNRSLKELEYNVRQERFKESIKKEFENVVWKPFQQLIINELDNIADVRKIKWIYDDKGNSGKSYLARYLMTHRDIYYITGGKQNDILYGYNGQNIIIYDLARTYADNLEHIYTTIENFKNGQYLSTKYETQQRIFEVPHIIVMANFKPDITKLSNDRWDIIDVNKEDKKTQIENNDIKEQLKKIENPVNNNVYLEYYKYILEVEDYKDIRINKFIDVYNNTLCSD